MATTSSYFSSPILVFSTAFLLRTVLLTYGIFQDSMSALKYTDIDYYVFTDASRAVARQSSPYDRATYRYTPLLAWILLPTSAGGLWFHFGKAIFAGSDLIAGWLILNVLRMKGHSQTQALKYASVWLLNPMVANISTRGSSEGLLCVLVMALLWAFESRHMVLSGVLLGLSVHFKIYPFIYGASMLWALETKPALPSTANLGKQLQNAFNQPRLTLVCTSLFTFSALNALMYIIYGPPFIKHTFLHHLTRVDHRHNFSPYNTLLYLSSADVRPTIPLLPSLSFESLAFLPQIALSLILLPISLSRLSLPSCMLAQTLAFVTFNKVCTSQYFLWYMVFLPLYLPTSSFTRRPRIGLTALGLWIAGQTVWLQQGYGLEFLGRSTFVPGLWIASMSFFAANCWILGVIIKDVLGNANARVEKQPKASVERKEGPGIATQSGELKSTEMFQPAPSPMMAQAERRDRKASVSGTSIGKVHLGPRNRVLKSSPAG